MRSIGLKLWTGIMIFAAVVLFLLAGFQILFLKVFYVHSKVEGVLKGASFIIHEIEEQGVSSAFSSEEITDELKALLHNHQLTIQIIDANGQSLYTDTYERNGGAYEGSIRAAQNQLFRAALSGEQTSIEVNHPKFGSKITMLGIPIWQDGTVQAAFLLSMPLAPVEETADILKQQLLIITFVLLLLSVVMAFILSRTFTKPILEITKASEQFSSGDFEYRIAVKGRDEISLLARRMNQMGEELSATEQLRKDFVANVSHELRTPLSLIKGYAETLRDVTGGIPEKREKQLGVIISETDRLTRLVEDILSLSRYQSGGVNLALSTFSARELLDRIVLQYELVMQTRDFSAECTWDGNVTGDSARIEQVLHNFLSNACNHTQEGEKIVLRALDVGERVRFEVEDGGEGIPNENLQYIFERFYKGPAESTGRQGTGLGLAIVKSILDLHKAPYGVKSTLGEGTLFWFELPKG